MTRFCCREVPAVVGNSDVPLSELEVSVCARLTFLVDAGSATCSVEEYAKASTAASRDFGSVYVTVRTSSGERSPLAEVFSITLALYLSDVSPA